jgi:hypothetical protein
MHYLLIDDVAPDYLSRRGEFRREHLVHAWKSVERGEMLSACAENARLASLALATILG